MSPEKLCRHEEGDTDAMMYRRRFLKSLVGLAVLPFAPLAALAPKFATGGVVRHVPELVGGCYTVGLSGPMWMQYNRGPTKWNSGHCVIYRNGRMVNIPITGRYA